MNKLSSLKEWLATQFKTKPLPSYFALAAVLLTVVVGVLFGLGVFDSAELDQSNFSYLPDREYILGSKEEERPKTLADLLLSEDPDIEDFLLEPKIAEELLAAENLVDVVDSRYALNNLRKIEEQLEERTKETEEDLPKGDLITLDYTEPKKPEKEVDPSDPAERAKPYMPEEAPLEERPAVEKEESAKSLDEAAESILVRLPAEGKHVKGSYLSQQELINQLNTKVDQLLAPREFGEWVELPSSINLKAVWENPGRSLVHFVPEGDWLPEEGYKIYRIIGEEKVLIEDRAAAPQGIEKTTFKHMDGDLVKSVYKEADYSKEDAAVMGMDKRKFNATVYRVRTMEEQERIDGEKDFQLMKSAQITIPDGIDQKIPQSDKALNSFVHIHHLPENGRYEAGVIRSKVWERFSVKQAELPYGIQELEENKEQYDVAAKTLEARQQIATMSFVDDEFAEEAGFLLKDDLKELKLKDGEKITYLLETPDGKTTSIDLESGKELNLSKPDGFMGYGLDGKVSLRWRMPASEEEKKITSGYYVERKLQGESEFTQVNEKPIVISEVMDEAGVFFETPVMYQDLLTDGTQVEYRMYSIDIFGRKSDYSEVIALKVEKVTPPDAPTTASLSLSDKVLESGDDPLSKALQETLKENSGKKGIIVPIFNESPDTVRFTLYRAEKVGTGPYGEPVPLANFNYDNPKKGQNLKEGLVEEESKGNSVRGMIRTQSGLYDRGRLNQSLHLFLKTNEPKAPDMVYFDSKIKEGVTYKYWVSAWDSWNNESAWSKSAALGVESEEEPKLPSTLDIAMMRRDLPDKSHLSPGLVSDENVSREESKEYLDLPRRDVSQNTTIIEKADLAQADIGSFLKEGKSPYVVTKYFDNLPQQKYIHLFIAVRGKDVLPDGSVRLRWPAYSGDDLGGYSVYQGELTAPDEEVVATLKREELLEMGQWSKLNAKALEQNQFLVQGLDPNSQGITLFLICLEPEESKKQEASEETQQSYTSVLAKEILKNAESFAKIQNALAGIPINSDLEAGHVYLDWDDPEDLQVSSYKVYRSEVRNFKKPVKENDLEWTLIADQLPTSQYTDKVEQSHAHYYYYKITSVSLWGVESSEGIIQKYRVPSTKPPQTPNLLLPLSRKDGIEVNFTPVQYCSRYEVYRTEIPKLTIDRLKNMDLDVLAQIFTTPSEEDTFLTQMLKEGIKPLASGEENKIDALSRFKTVNLVDPVQINDSLQAIQESKRQDIYSKLIHQAGPLAVADYRDLSIPMLKLVKWEKVGELPVGDEEEETKDPASLQKPLSIIDKEVDYGTFYLYTVQAWNDDDLGSTRPEPVEATPRRNKPFDPVDGLEGWINREFRNVELQWNLPTMEGLTKQQCLDDTVGFIVYYSTEKDGPYHQVSPLLFFPRWSDFNTDISATNWYRVKVLDTGGYLSEFSEPILVYEKKSLTAPETKIPTPELTEEEVVDPPILRFEASLYRTFQGEELRIPYSISGTEPITYEVQAVSGQGLSYQGMSIDQTTKQLVVPSSAEVGDYEVSVKAKNKAGEDEAFLTIHVLGNPSTNPVGKAPKLGLEKDDLVFMQWDGGEISYTIEGDDPIRYTMSLTQGKEYSYDAPSFTHMMDLDMDAKKLRFSEELPWGFYTGYLIAENSYGMDRKDFKLEIRAKIAEGERELDLSSLVLSTKEPSSLVYEDEAQALDISFATRENLAPEVLKNVDLFRPSLPEGIDIDLGKLVLQETYTKKEGSFEGFPLEDIELTRPTVHKAGQPKGYTGTAKLIFDSSEGTKRWIPVQIINVELYEEDGRAKLVGGTVYIDKAHELEDIGVTITSLNITKEKGGIASGFVKSAKEGKTLLGNLPAFVFEDATFMEKNRLLIKAKNPEYRLFPSIRFGALTLDKTAELVLRLDASPNHHDFLILYGQVSLKAPLETLNNEGLKMSHGGLGIDLEGKPSGHFKTETEGGQFLQLLVPGGSGLRVEASVVYKRGVATEEGWIKGKLMLPFERAGIQGPGIPANYAGYHPISGPMEENMIPVDKTEELDAQTFNSYLIHFGKTVQKNGLLILPDDTKLQDGCAYSEFSVAGWKGEGFMVESAELTPVSVADRYLKLSDQKKQAIIVRPQGITIDLDRQAFLPRKENAKTPGETEEPFWVGLVIKQGHLELPTHFIQTKDKEAIKFGLAEGEMIYDLNGFNYQTFLYNDQGVEASFGSALGNFEEVWVYDCLLDMYANKVNLEINAEVALELFNYNRVKVKLYTNEEDNENGKAGQFLCSVAPCEMGDFVGTKTKLSIEGGFVDEDGLRIRGSVELATEEIQIKKPMTFSSLKVPAKKEMTFEGKNKDKKYGWATLDKDVPVHMQGFELSIREINFEYLSAEKKANTPTRLSLWGSVMLSETIPLGSDTTDRIALDTLISSSSREIKPEELRDPIVILDDSFSVLDTSFDECIDVKGVLIPKRIDESKASSGSKTASKLPGINPQSSDEMQQKLQETKVKADEKLGQIQQGLIEFETENLELGFLGSLGELPVDTITRFGYDVDNKRCYFSIGLVKKGEELNVGVGSMKEFSGLVVNNMIVQRDEQLHLIFPKNKEEMKNYIHKMEVDRTKDARFSAAMKGTMSIEGLCEVRNLYFGFENGPLVEAAGGLYLPLDVQAILTPSGDAFKHVGDVAILYSHPQRYFSFSMTLNKIDVIAIKLSGSLGFEFSPKLFGVYVGYPETLAGNVHIYRVGLGLGFRLDDDGANIVKAKVEFGLEKEVEVAIVYLRGYLYAGADGGYYANFDVDGDGIPEGDKFILTLYLKGGLEGGIKVSGKRFNIISLYLDARGTIESIPPEDEWKLSCSAKVSYSLNLFLFKVSGSVKASFDHTLSH